MAGYLTARGAEAIVLACTEIEPLLGPDAAPVSLSTPRGTGGLGQYRVQRSV
ncbi:MAG: hypothetical protein Q8Q02_16390 [Nocardioides sp.]|nr:hypothetical protein [Nocardioides sp.]